MCRLEGKGQALYRSAQNCPEVNGGVDLGGKSDSISGSGPCRLVFKSKKSVDH